MDTTTDSLVQTKIEKEDITSKDSAIKLDGPYSKYILLVLVLVYIFNLVDRQLLTILAEDVKADLDISDSELGFLFGTAFSVFYATIGMVLGRLADFSSRKRLIAIGLSFWSLMTALSGTANSFLTLSIFRFGVATGEASATPSSFSILYDCFSPKIRTLVLSIYGAGGAIGTDGPEDMKAYEYSVLVTDTTYDVTGIFHHYRDRADCENNFDELKNQWGWAGYTTKDIHSSATMAQMIALVYNWWNLYSRLALPDIHHEAITSRPLLLSSIGRLVSSAGQKTLKLTSMHGHSDKLVDVYQQLIVVFQKVKATAPQLSSKERWRQMIAIIMARIGVKNRECSPPSLQPVLT